MGDRAGLESGESTGRAGTSDVPETSNPHGEAPRTAAPAPDEVAIERCLAGDADAFGPLVVAYQDRIFHACVRMLGDREAASEVVQESFLRAFQKLSTFRRGARFSTWLFTIAINQCRSELRRRKTKKHRPPLSLDAARTDERGGGYEPPSSEPDPSAGVLREETGRRVARELEGLPETYREPVVLRDVEDLAYEEIAEILGVPVGTVRSRIHRGRAILRERLSDLVSGG